MVGERERRMIFVCQLLKVEKILPPPSGTNNVVTSSSANKQLFQMTIFSVHCYEDDISVHWRASCISNQNKQPSFKHIRHSTQWITETLSNYLQPVKLLLKCSMAQIKITDLKFKILNSPSLKSANAEIC